MKTIDIFNQQHAEVNNPFIIAEIGVNHENDLELAKRLIDEAKEGGADAVKFQTYKAETLASKYSPAYWDTSKETTASQYELFKKHDKFWKKEMETLKIYSDKLDIEFLSTPFDIDSANFLNDLMSTFKISSSDITNKPFIEHIAAFKKPIILSTGASNLEEINDAVFWINQYDNPLALLHCVLNYPTKDENANLGMILSLKKYFPNNIIGYSDHTLPKDMKVCELATILGSQIIEKHFTHDKTLPGNDHYHAMDKYDLKILRENINRSLDIVGSFEIDSLESEQLSRQNARRSLVITRDIKKGESISKMDLTFKRPGNGISPKHIDELIGLKAIEDLAEDTVLQWDMLNE